MVRIRVDVRVIGSRFGGLDYGVWLLFHYCNHITATFVDSPQLER